MRPLATVLPVEWLPPDRFERIGSALTAAAVSGVRMGIPGQPFTEDLESGRGLGGWPLEDGSRSVRVDPTAAADAVDDKQRIHLGGKSRSADRVE